MFDRARAWDPRSVAVEKSCAAHLALWKGTKPSAVPQKKLELPDKNAPLPTPSSAAG
jgi:hypothetical protein